jgi:hypothetical protein
MAKHVSEVEDGFALNRGRDKARKGGTMQKKRALGTECTIPPPPVKHILSSYTMSNPISKRSVSDYDEIRPARKLSTSVMGYSIFLFRSIHRSPAEGRVVPASL